ncbi:hypothetical protein ACIRBX_31680 [Kitasatospora sp. NPDC096147]|uniref:hypothetical protein n=1 Tax=Kitasatospora sp. NPDC096147 TaxID=3364093 RepID=UPI00381BB9F6
MSVALRTALALYPARYRRDRGAELAEVFEDVTAGAGRLATVREAFDLAAYGLRMRTGLTATALGGRLLAVGAPLLAGALVGLSVLPGIGDERMFHVRRAARAGLAAPWHELVGNLALLGLAVVPVLLALAAATNAWRAARVLGAGVALLAVVRLADIAVRLQDPYGWDAWFFVYSATAVVPHLIGGAMLAATPGELLDSRGRADRLLLLAGTVAGFAVTRAQGGYSSRNLMDGWWPVALLLVPLVLMLFAARGRLLPAALGLAVLPLTAAFSLFSLWEQVGGVWRLAPAALLVAATLLLAVRLLGRGRPQRALEF